MDFYLFRSGDPERFRQAFGQALENCMKQEVYRGSFEAAVSGILSHKDGITLVSLDKPGAGLMKELGRVLGSPRVAVLLQEKSFWELLVYLEDKCPIRFSTAPSEWGDYPPDKYYGTPQDLARIWGVPAARIERYMVDWEPGEVWNKRLKMMSRTFLKKGKAYPEDEYEYGSEWQAYDFIRAMGGDPENLKGFQIELPSPPGKAR